MSAVGDFRLYFAECPLVGTSLGSMLAIHKRIDILAIVARMGDRAFYIITFQVNDRVAECVRVGLAGKQVQQSVFGDIVPAIKMY